MPYRVEYHHKAFVQLEEITRGDKKSALTIADAIDELANNPRPKGVENISHVLFRIRTRDYRVIYGIEDRKHLVGVLKIERRNENTYKNLGNLSKRFKRMINDLENK